MSSTRFLICFLSVISAHGRLQADDTLTVSNRSELSTALSHARPGDTIQIAPGTYRGGLSFDNLQGTADQPLRIEGADADNPPVIEGGSSGLHLSDPAHLELRNLVFAGAEGNGLNIDDDGSKDSPAHHVLLTGDRRPRRRTARQPGWHQALRRR